MNNKEILLNKLLDCDAAKFQKICDDYFRENGFPKLISYGLTIKGAKTKKGTPDSYCINDDGSYTFFEYSTEQGNVSTKLESDIKKCLDLIKKANSSPINEDINCKTIIFVVTSNNLDSITGNNVIEKCKSFGIDLRIICLNELCNMLLKNGKKIAEEAFNVNLCISPVCDIEEFIYRNKNKFGCDYSKKLYGRSLDLKNLEEAVNNNDIVIVSGESGVGKTKLVLEYLKNSPIHTIVIENRMGDINHDLIMEIEDYEQCILFFDDANNITQMKQCLEDVFRVCSDVKILLTVRNYAKDSVVRLTNQFKVTSKVYLIDSMSNDEIKEIIEKNYGIKNSNYQDRIIKISKGNSRIAIIASEKIIMNEQNTFIWEDSASLLSEYYSDIIKKNVSLNYETNKDLLGVLSVLKKIDLQEDAILLKISELIGVNEFQIKIRLNELYNLEIVDIYLGRVVKIADQCLQDYFIYDTFINRRSILLKDLIDVFFTEYSKEVIDSVNCLINVYTSEKGNELIKSEILCLWDELESQKKLTSSFVYSFASVDSNRAYKWCDEHIFEKKNKTDEQLDINERNYYPSNECLQILEQIYINDYNTLSISLIFESLSYDELRMQALDIIKRLSGLQIDDFDNKFIKQKTLIETLMFFEKEKWFGTVAKVVCNEILKFNFSYTCFEEGRNVQFCSFSLNDDYMECLTLRNKTWNLLKKIDNEKAYDVIYSYFNEYGENIKNIFFNDISNIEEILENIENCNKYYEMFIYGNSMYHFFLYNKSWEYMETKYLDDLDDILLILDPKDSDLSYENKKNEFECNVESRAKSDSIEESIQILNKAIEMYKVKKEYKIETFINTYIFYCKNNVIDWVTKEIDSFINLLGPSIIYTICRKFSNEIEFMEVINHITDNVLKKEFYVCYVNLNILTTQESKKIYLDIFAHYFCENNKHSLIKIRLDTIYKLCNNNEEFIEYIRKINNYYCDDFKGICHEYYANLFNPYIFHLEDILNIFENDIKVLEEAYLNHLNSNQFNYKESDYYFAICNQDSSFFDDSIESILIDKSKHKVIENIWNQEKCFAYAEKIFNVVHTIDEINVYYNIPDYFGLSVRSSNKRKNVILEWAKYMVDKNLDTNQIIDLSKIIVETGEKNNCEFISHLINFGISDDTFKLLRIDPRIVSYSGSEVPYVEKKIEFYRGVLSKIVNPIKNRKIVALINERIDRLNNYIIEVKVRENLRGGY